MQNPILAGLNAPQIDAVEVLSGPLLILAGAGSGKTKCLTHRIANLMANGVPGGSILAVTFTNKAANEMRSRVEALLGQLPVAEMGYSLPTLGTFHAVCVRILREEIIALNVGITRHFIIADTDDQRSLVKTILQDLGYDPKEYKPRAVHGHIGMAKDQLWGPEEYYQATEQNRFTKCVYAVYKEYQKRLRGHNAVDFDDLIFYAVKLFSEHPKTLLKYTERWQYLLIDEYQDTNTAQYKLVRLLGDGHQNVCAIGDDAQSIYSFRGADFTNILNFEKDFPTAKIIKLEQNYRSTKSILDCANAVISHNRTGIKKALWTEKEPGEKVKIVQVTNEREEGDYIARTVKELTRGGDFQRKDCVVLYRMNAQSRALEEALMRHSVPYKIIGGTRFFDRREVKDVIAYLRLIFNPRDDQAFLRIINVPKRQLGKKTIEDLKSFARGRHLSLLEACQTIGELDGLTPSKKQKLSAFSAMIFNLRKAYAEGAIGILLDRLLEKIDYLKWLDDGTAEGEARIQNVRELFSVAAKYETAELPLASFLEGVALVSDLDNYEEDADTLTLMTMHSAKGLVWPVVFLPGWEDGVFPSNASQMHWEQMEEERRLAYVGLTRAKEKCAILHARARMIYGKTEYAKPSPFIAELDKTATEFLQLGAPAPNRRTYNSLSVTPKTRKEALFGVVENTSGYVPGQRVRHGTWGEGTVIQISGDVLSVAFSGMGIKKIVASVAPLEKLSD